MQPSTIALVDTMPLLPSGKIDGRALLARDDPAPAPKGLEPTAEPSERARRLVAEAWCTVLDRSSLDRGLSFADSRGDSLQLLKFLFLLEQRCGNRLPLGAFSVELTPLGCAQILDRVFAGPPSSRPDNDAAGSDRLEIALVRELEAAYAAAAAPAEMPHARPYQWANACHELFAAGRLDTLEHAVRHLRRAYPDLDYLQKLESLLDSLPKCQPPPLAFTDDPAADIQIVARPGCGDVLLCFCAGGGTLGLPLNFVHQWLGRLPASLVYLKDFRDLSGGCGYPSLGPDRAAACAGLRRLVEALDASRILAFGVSAGGYAALHYGLELGAAGVLTICGRVDCTADFLAASGPLPQDCVKIYREAPGYARNLRDAYVSAAQKTRVQASYSRGVPGDRRQAERLDGLAGVTLIPVDCAQHNTIDPLIREGCFLPLLQRLLAPEP